MNIELEKNKKFSMPQELLWDTIIEVTESIKSEEAKALRIPLYFFLAGRGKSNLRDLLRCFCRLLRWMTSAPAMHVPNAPKGRLLFVFLFNTASNINNLRPVFQAAKRRVLSPEILTGEGVVIDQKELNGAGSIVNVRQLMAITSVSERLAALILAGKQYSALISGFKSVNTKLAETLRLFRFQIFTEIALYSSVSCALKALYSSWEPSCVISTSDFWPFDHAVFAVARDKGIPSFVVQHGITAKFWWPFVADRLLLWGEPFRDELQKLGAPSSRLAVCGMPATDHLFSKRYSDRRTLIDQCSSSSSYLILSDTQTRNTHPEIYSKYRVFLKAVVAATPSTRWFVKLHPNEDESFYREFQFENFTVLPKSTALENAVMQADVACTIWSTAGLEAMVMQKPLVIFDLDPIIRNYAWWPKCDGGMYIGTAEAMIEFVNKNKIRGQFLMDLVKKQDGFLANTFSNHGRAAEAVIDEIEHVLGINKLRRF